MVPGFRFGRVEVRPSERKLLVDGGPAPIGARAFDVLLVLVERRDRTVTKRELLERVWPGLVVEENNLQVQISTLRRVLGTSAIVTVPGRGYRFVLPASPDEVTRDAASQPPLAGAESHHNLPPERSRFIGREPELAECRRLLDESRLVTLVAIGGCGKTRMALHLARMLRPEQPDGVWFVDLAPLQEGTRVPLAVGAALGVFEQPGRPLADALMQRLAGCRALLVMDNCEHVAAAAMSLVDTLLRACPSLRIVATSRVPLGLEDERVFALPPLACPGPGENDEPERFDAVRLFLDRLRRAAPDVELAPGNTAVVADICRRLDGIPLALELAAARAKVLTLPEIQVRLDQRFRLLTGTAPGGRSHTLLSAIQWSYDQLSAPTQRLFRCLGVFAGGWTLEALMAVAGDDRDEFDALDALASLVDQSLVIVQHRGSGESRYSLLETVRLFALELLQQAGELHGARTRHLRYMAQWVEAGAPQMQGAQQRDWLLRLDADRENLLLAHAWCEEMDAADRCGLRLVSGLQGYWRSRGIADLGYEWGRRIVERARGCEPCVTQAEALFAVGDLAYFLGRYQEAHALLGEALALSRALGAARQEALSQLMLGITCLGQGNWPAARHHCTQSLAQTRALGDPAALNSALMAVGVLHLAGREFDAAAPVFEESLALARDRGAPISIGLNLLNLAWVGIGQNRCEAARRDLLDAMRIVQDIGHESLAQMTLDSLAAWCAQQQLWRPAARFYGAGQAAIERMRQRRQPAIDAMLAPHLERLHAALGSAEFDTLREAGRLWEPRAALEAARGTLEGLAPADLARDCSAT